MSTDHDAAAHVSTTAEAARDFPSEKIERREEELKELLDDAVRSLPPKPVEDLLSRGVCSRCILRLLAVQGLAYTCSSLSPSTFSCVLGFSLEDDGHAVPNGSSESCNLPSAPSQKAERENEICIICLGILQFAYCDENKNVVRKNNAFDMAASIADMVKHEGHEIDSYSLEVSIPSIILENEEAVRSYMTKKYGAEPWFQQCLNFECISVKDALKLSISDRLETSLDTRYGMGPFRIRLTYTHAKASKAVQDYNARNWGIKKRKVGAENGCDAAGRTMAADSSSSDHLKNNTNSIDAKTCGPPDLEPSVCVKILLEKVNEPCQLTYSCYRTPIYIGGRYLKYSRNVSQTRWIIDDERMGEASIEEIIGSGILPFCRSDNYKFHAAGREDIDVRMLGSGRPFLVEVQNARRVPSEASLKEIEAQINNTEPKLVGVKNLKLVDSQGWDMMREGEAEKQKQYTAVVWISRPLQDKDLKSVSSHKDMQVLQRTPIRVLHRRSPLDREKIIHWMKIEKIPGSSQYFLLHLCTQAGTYIKEFVHGDLGRTSPSIGSILGCRAEILQLDVTDVKMDCFVDV